MARARPEAGPPEWGHPAEDPPGICHEETFQELGTREGKPPLARYRSGDRLVSPLERGIRACRSAERRTLPASSRSGSSTNSMLRGTL